MMYSIMYSMMCCKIMSSKGSLGSKISELLLLIYNSCIFITHIFNFMFHVLCVFSIYSYIHYTLCMPNNSFLGAGPIYLFELLMLFVPLYSVEWILQKVSLMMVYGTYMPVFQYVWQFVPSLPLPGAFNQFDIILQLIELKS